MAIYSTRMRIVSMAKGSSAMKSSAYISGEGRDRELTGLAVRRYARAERVFARGVELPDGAPAELEDPGALWNAAEVFEAAHGGGQVARMERVAIPRELTPEQAVELVRAHCAAYTRQGACVEWAVHGPRGDNGNWHAHILSTTRPLSGSYDPEKPGAGAFVETKTVKEYYCRRDGEGRMLTADELKTEKKNGWEKVFNYPDGERRTLSEAAALEMRRDPSLSEKEAKKLARAARTSKYAVSVKREVSGWDRPEFLEGLRKDWEDRANEALAAAGSDERISRLSYAERGIEKIPTRHLGYRAAAIERRAEAEAIAEGCPYEPVTRVGRYNAEAREANRLIEALRSRADEIGRAISAAASAVRAWWDRPEPSQEARRRMELGRSEGVARGVGAARRDVRELLRDVREAVARALEHPGANVPKQVRADLARSGVSMGLEGGEFAYARGTARAVGPEGADRDALAPRGGRTTAADLRAASARLSAEISASERERSEASKSSERQQSIEVAIDRDNAIDRWE